MSRAKKEYAFHRYFWQLVFNEHAPTHVRVPNQEPLGVFLVGHATALHGVDGVCRCCHGRGAA